MVLYKLDSPLETLCRYHKHKSHTLHMLVVSFLLHSRRHIEMTLNIPLLVSQPFLPSTRNCCKVSATIFCLKREGHHESFYTCYQTYKILWQTICKSIFVLSFCSSLVLLFYFCSGSQVLVQCCCQLAREPLLLF